MSSRNIFVAVDESSHSVGAYNFALDNIAKKDDIVTVIVVVSSESEREMAVERTTTLIRAIADPDHLDVKYKVQVLVPTALQKIGPLLCDLVEEKKPDMLVLGSAGKSHLEGFLVGSVSNHCIAHANCPVIVARVTPADELKAQKKASRIPQNHPMYV
ncbi:hypothetical protein HDU79_000015 [Rhizoclosmatium sp. JEL0117]|nr:hypothetical protein HDU79_000015 [Rhizoclosmatium sp. JEL0117]